MRAIALDRFGGPDVLRLHDDLDDPPLAPDGVRIDVRAAGLNPVDWKIREGYLRGAFPHVLPVVPGWDLAGVVDQVGPAVTEWVPGDEVFAYARTSHVHLGTYAELCVLPATQVARKPPSLSFADAAAIPLAALTALQMLERIDVNAEDTVLIQGASGGVGHFAVQLAKARGATVVATAGAANQAFLAELGADHALDYAAGDVAERLRELLPGGITAALDLFGEDPLATAVALLRESSGGRVATIARASGDPEVAGVPVAYVFVRPSAPQLDELAALIEDGRLRVTVQQAFPLERAAEAHALLEDGHVRGKLVLEL